MEVEETPAFHSVTLSEISTGKLVVNGQGVKIVGNDVLEKFISDVFRSIQYRVSGAGGNLVHIDSF